MKNLKKYEEPMFTKVLLCTNDIVCASDSDGTWHDSWTTPDDNGISTPTAFEMVNISNYLFDS